MTKATRWCGWAAAAGALLMAGCGGGGSASSPSAPAPDSPRQLAGRILASASTGQALFVPAESPDGRLMAGGAGLGVTGGTVSIDPGERGRYQVSISLSSRSVAASMIAPRVWLENVQAGRANPGDVRADYVVTTFAGTPGSAGNVSGPKSVGRLNQPRYVEILESRVGADPLIVASLSQVARISPNGDIEYIFSSPAVEIRDIARGSDGTLWLAMADHVLRRISTDTGQEIQVVGTPGSTGHVAGSDAAARFNVITQLESTFVIDNNGIRPFNSSSGAVQLAAGSPIAANSDVASLDSEIWGHSYLSAQAGNNRLSTFTTNPGTRTDLGTGTGGLTNGLANQARFFGPLGVFATGRRAWVSDSQNRAIRMVHLIGDHGPNRSYYVTTIAGGNGVGTANGPGDAAQFTATNRIVVDQSASRPRDEDIYVVDTNAHTVRRILRLGRLPDVPTTLTTVSTEATGFPGATFLPNPTGALNPSWQVNGELQLQFPMILPEGTDTLVADVYVAGVPEESTSLSAVVNGSGTDVAGSPSVSVVTIAGRQGSGGYSDGPGSVAAFGAQLGLDMDESMNLFVADTDSGTVRWRNFGGSFATILGTPFLPPGPAIDGNGFSKAGAPYDVAVSNDGKTLWYTDAVHHVIRRATYNPANGEINHPGAWTTVTLYGSAGTPGDVLGTGTVARLNQPRGITIDPSGSVLYVADRGNNKIKRFSAFGGPIALLAGSGAAGANNGVGALATFSQPEDVAVGLAGDVFVSDPGNRLIRRVSPAGAASTVAGAAGITGMVDSSTGSGARFTQPASLAADNNGFLFVADKRISWVVRRISPSGQTATVAGVSSLSAVSDGPGASAGFGTGPSLVLTSTPRGELMTSSGNTIREIHHFISSASP